MSEKPQVQAGISYTIQPESVISFSGNDFIYLKNTLDKILQSPTYQERLAIANEVAAVGMLHEVLTNKFKELVEGGVAIPTPVEEPEPAHTMD